MPPETTKEKTLRIVGQDGFALPVKPAFRSLNQEDNEKRLSWASL
jgi:hypothetical protein